MSRAVSAADQNLRLQRVAALLGVLGRGVRGVSAACSVFGVKPGPRTVDLAKSYGAWLGQAITGQYPSRH